MACLERDVQPYLSFVINNMYWDCASDHEDFRKIINAIEAAGASSPRLVASVLDKLHKAGYVIKKI